MSVEHAPHANGTARLPHAAEPGRPLGRAADAVLDHARTGGGAEALPDALAALAADPREEVRDAAALIAADARAAVPAGAAGPLEELLVRAGSARLAPGAAVRRLAARAAAELADGTDGEALLRFAVAAHRQLRQAHPVTPDAAGDVAARVARLDPAALAACDRLADDPDAAAGRLAAAVLRGTGRATRPEWKAACDASQTALDVFKRLERRLPATAPWRPAPVAVAAVAALAVFVLGLGLGAVLRRPAERVETVVVPGPAPAPAAPAAPRAAPPAPTPPPLVGPRKIIVIAPDGLAKSPAGIELAARFDAVLHGTGPREKDAKAPAGPPVEIIPYAPTATAAWLSGDALLDPAAEPVVVRMGQLGLLGGADHAAFVRPVRTEGDATVAVVTVVKLEPAPVPPAAKDATPAKAWAEPASATRAFSDVWLIPGVVPPTAADRRALRLGLAGATDGARVRVIAELLIRQPGATGDDYALAAAVYLHRAAPVSDEVARARAILWAGYARGRTDDLTRLLVGVEEQLANRVGLLAANPGVLHGPDRSSFVDAQADAPQTAFRFNLAQKWAAEKLAEVLRDYR